MSENAKVALIIIALMVLYGIVGRMDYTDQLEQENQRLRAQVHHKCIIAGNTYSQQMYGGAP